MTSRIDVYRRLEAHPNDHDIQNGFAARIHDPIWMLARQWQMGEHQGENASSPVKVDGRIATTLISSAEGDTGPMVVPAEAIVESELDDWWTMGRRIRAGQLFTRDPRVSGHNELRLVNPPPPYDALVGQLDGREVWRARASLQIGEAEFGAERPAPDSPDRWRSDLLSYEASFAAGECRLDVVDHDGGPMDWYSADAAVAVGAPAEGAELPPTIPVPLEYPGAPHARFWEIEDAAVDIGGYAPDTAHFATMLLVDLVYSHGDDWFLFPVRAKAGSIVTLQRLKVTDAFGKKYSTAPVGDNDTVVSTGLEAPADFTLFATKGLANASLTLWPVAESPLESNPVERVQFGVDEHANLLWAVERIVDSREVFRDARPADPDHPAYPPPQPPTDLQKPREFSFVPAMGAESHWHPYQLNWSAADTLAFEQWGLADYSLQVPRPLPHAAAEVLKAGTPGAPELHKIVAAAVVSGGFEIERRWELARDMKGRPVLWIQRQRRNLRSPPARTLRYDMLLQTAAGE